MLINTSKKSKNHDHINPCELLSYHIYAFLLIVLEHVLPIPLMIGFFQTFVCQSKKLNFVGEMVAYPLSQTQCWNGEHIAILVFGAFSICFFIPLLLCSFLFYSSSCYVSPLPWADYNIFQKLNVLCQKIIIASFLVFDPQVFKSFKCLIDW